MLLGYERTGNTSNVLLGGASGTGGISGGGIGGGGGGSSADIPKSQANKHATYLNLYLTIQVILLVIQTKSNLWFINRVN